jgi:gp16 family phage-associated protein
MATKGRRWKPLTGSGAVTELKAAIRAELRADGCTQADLARYLGLSEKHVSQVLTGKAVGAVGTLEEMAAAVGLAMTVGREGP